MQLKVTLTNFQAAKENLRKFRKIFYDEEIQQAKTNYEKTKALLSLAEKDLADCFIISPIDGFVLKKYFETIEFVTISTLLLLILNLSEPEMVVFTTGIDIGEIKYGQRSEIIIDS